MLDIILWPANFMVALQFALGMYLCGSFHLLPQVPHLQYWQRLPVFPGLHLLAKFTFCQSMSKTSSILLLLETPFSRLLHVFLPCSDTFDVPSLGFSPLPFPGGWARKPWNRLLLWDSWDCCWHACACLK